MRQAEVDKSRRNRLSATASPRRFVRRRGAAAALCLLSSSSDGLPPRSATAFRSPSLNRATRATRTVAERLHESAAPFESPKFGTSPALRMAVAPLVERRNVTAAGEDGSRDPGVRNGEIAPIASNAPNETNSAELSRDDPHHGRTQLPPLLQKVADKVGKIDESRIVSSPEYLSGEVPKLFSNIRYETTKIDGSETPRAVKASHSESSLLESSALLCGTALGCGLLFLPSAVGCNAGYLPTIAATLVAWGYMTVSALLTSELLINRYGETGKARNVGLLELYTSYLGEAGGRAAGLAFLIVSYLVMGVYLSEGGDQLARFIHISASPSSSILGGEFSWMLDNPYFVARTLFATTMGAFLLAAARFNTVQRTVTRLFVPATLIAFVAAMSIGVSTADFGLLTDSKYQHPELVLNSFPLLFMGWTYHGVVPRVVYDLEGDKDKITKAIAVGSTTALVVYLTWNAMILGNVLGGEADAGGLSAGASTSTLLADSANPNPTLQASVAAVSELAIVTSFVGVVLGFVNEFNDAVGAVPSGGRGHGVDGKWKVGLLTLLPPALASVALGCRPVAESNYEVVDYAGIFGSSALFLILPALMAWESRYGEGGDDDDGGAVRPLTVRPMVPLGKIPLGSLYKAAGTLIAEQGLEKLGAFDFVRELWRSRG